MLNEKYKKLRKNALEIGHDLNALMKWDGWVFCRFNFYLNLIKFDL